MHIFGRAVAAGVAEGVVEVDWWLLAGQFGSMDEEHGHLEKFSEKALASASATASFEEDVPVQKSADEGEDKKAATPDYPVCDFFGGSSFCSVLNQAEQIEEEPEGHGNVLARSSNVLLDDGVDDFENSLLQLDTGGAGFLQIESTAELEDYVYGDCDWPLTAVNDAEEASSREEEANTPDEDFGMENGALFSPTGLRDTGPTKLYQPSQDELDALKTERQRNALKNFFCCFGQLMAFKEANGHCNIPQNHKLGHWVNRLRTREKRRYDKGKSFILNEERVNLLEQQGFRWSMVARGSASFEKHYNELKAFKEEHGHCDVPVSFGRFVSEFRSKYFKGILSQEQINRLNEIGFQWEAKPKGRDKMGEEESPEE